MEATPKNPAASMTSPAAPPSTTGPDPHVAPSPHQSTARTLRIGTRSSALALAQVSLFTTLLATTHPSLQTTTHPLSTNLGDTNKTTDLHTLASGGKALWTEDLETELLNNRVDVLIHSLKDVPTKLPVGCKVRAVGRREEKRDAVLLRPGLRGPEAAAAGLGSREENPDGLSRLQPGSAVGTSSVRRGAMIRRRYPALRIVDCRGNVPTRVRKLDEPKEGEQRFDALVLAGAGVQRLGMGDRIDGWLGWEQGLGHAVGQGALGVEWRDGDEWVEGLVAGLEEGLGRSVRWEGAAERSLLRVLEGGCSVPVGVDAQWEDGGGTEALLCLKGMVVSVDGQHYVESERRKKVRSDEQAEACGLELAQELVEKGAGEILKDIELDRAKIRRQDNA